MDVRYEESDGGATSTTGQWLLSVRQQGLWKLYQTWLQTNQNKVLLADETISRLLLWAPHSEIANGDGQWRQVVWGFLSLHRLTVDLALREHNHSTSDDAYGTSISLSTDANFPASSLRIALTILQCLGPIAQELAVVGTQPQQWEGDDATRVRNEPTSHNDARTACRQARVRLYLEKARFALRLTLLIGYWRRMWQQYQQQQEEQRLVNADSANIAPGLLLDGGLYHVYRSGLQGAPSIEQERARIERQQYRGRRTNRRVVTARDRQHEETQQSPQKSRRSFGLAVSRILLGELLYIFRPLFWAQAEDATVGQDLSTRWNAWIVSLGMDLASLASLKTSADSAGNSSTKEEWSRRRMRLFLYLLRSPAWERYTRRGTQALSGAVDVVPLFGKLFTNYLWDWLYYWKLYRAEEG